MILPDFNTDSDANKYIKTYFNGFVDVSGGDIINRTGNIYCNDGYVNATDLILTKTTSNINVLGIDIQAGEIIQLSGIDSTSGNTIQTQLNGRVKNSETTHLQQGIYNLTSNDLSVSNSISLPNTSINDNALSSNVSLKNGINAFTGTNTFNSNLPTSTQNPSLASHLITKAYGDATYGTSNAATITTIAQTTGTFYPVLTTANAGTGKAMSQDVDLTFNSSTNTLTTFGGRFYGSSASTDNGTGALVAGNPSCTFVGSISGTTLTISSISVGVIKVGMGIYDLPTGDSYVFILEGTNITAYVTGTGGTGTYTVSRSQTTTSRAMYSSGQGGFASGGDANINDLTVGKGKNNIRNNTAFGIGCLKAVTFGVSNTAIGYEALSSLTTGYDNIGIGSESLLACTTGTNNIGMGSFALSSVIGGTNNTGVGAAALSSVSSGTNNIGIGSSGQSINTGSFNTCIGDTTDCSSTGVYQTAIGAGSTNSVNNSLVLGRTADFVNIPSTGVATNTTTGALRVNGGVGINGDCYATSFNGTFNGSIANATTAASCSGNSATATNATNINVTSSVGNANYYIPLATSSGTGQKALVFDDTGAFTFNPSTNTVGIDNINLTYSSLPTLDGNKIGRTIDGTNVLMLVQTNVSSRVYTITNLPIGIWILNATLSFRNVVTATITVAKVNVGFSTGTSTALTFATNGFIIAGSLFTVPASATCFQQNITYVLNNTVVQNVGLNMLQTCSNSQCGIGSTDYFRATRIA